jgi:hypothetical protein
LRQKTPSAGKLSDARKFADSPAGGIHVIANGIPALILVLRATRAQIDRALKELGAE